MNGEYSNVLIYSDLICVVIGTKVLMKENTS